MFVPSKAFRIFLGDSCLILLKNRNLCAHENNFSKSQKRLKTLIFFTLDWYTNFSGHPIISGFMEFQKYSNKSDCYKQFCFDRFYFLCVVCLFWWLYGFLWWVFAIEKLEYNRYNARTKYELVCYCTYSSDLFSYTNGSHEGFVEFCVIEVFKFWVILRWMKD